MVMLSVKGSRHILQHSSRSYWDRALDTVTLDRRWIWSMVMPLSLWRRSRSSSRSGSSTSIVARFSRFRSSSSCLRCYSVLRLKACYLRSLPARLWRPPPFSSSAPSSLSFSPYAGSIKPSTSPSIPYNRSANLLARRRRFKALTHVGNRTQRSKRANTKHMLTANINMMI